LQPLSELFNVKPKFSYYSEADDGGKPNALASTDGSRGTVLFGTTLLNRLLQYPNGDYAAMAVCGHEYGHIVQYHGQVQPKITEQLPCYCIELHADFLAGYFIGTIFKTKLGAADIQQIGRAWSAWETQSCTHGSSVQRTQAIEAGYSFAADGSGRTVASAVDEGITYLKRRVPV
jgi:predicted metalloprotease